MPGPYTVTFTPGQSSATFMVPTEEDDTVELSEYFTLMITSVDRPDVVEIGSPNTSVITIVDNEEGNVQPRVICITWKIFPFDLFTLMRYYLAKSLKVSN